MEEEEGLNEEEEGEEEDSADKENGDEVEEEVKANILSREEK
jgi:hypothetical protein